MFSVITATLNAARTLERAIASLSNQGEAFQHIVVDGGSSDGTGRIVGKIGLSELVVAEGSSIYEAWNIGIGKATGRFILFLNADDEFLPGSLSAIKEGAIRHEQAELIAGSADIISDDGTLLGRHRAVPSGALEIGELALGVPAINAIAFRADLFKTRGLFPTNFRAAGDRSFLLRLALSGIPPLVARIESTIYRYHSHPGSLTLHRSLEQRLMIAREHFDLARECLDRPLTDKDARVLAYWRRREAAVGTLRCLIAGRPGESLRFAGRLARAELRYLTGRSTTGQ